MLTQGCVNMFEVEQQDRSEHGQQKHKDTDVSRPLPLRVKAPAAEPTGASYWPHTGTQWCSCDTCVERRELYGGLACLGVPGVEDSAAVEPVKQLSNTLNKSSKYEESEDPEPERTQGLAVPEEPLSNIIDDEGFMLI